MMLFFNKLPSSDDWLNEHTDTERNACDHESAESADQENSRTASHEQREKVTVTVEATGDSLLDQRSDGTSQVRVLSPGAVRNDACERSPLLSEPRVKQSNTQKSLSYNSCRTSPPQQTTSMWLKPCQAVGGIVSHLLWGVTHLVWEEVVVILYAVFIMIMCETLMQVSQGTWFKFTHMPIFLLGVLSSTC